MFNLLVVPFQMMPVAVYISRFPSSIDKSLEAANQTISVITFNYFQVNGSCVEQLKRAPQHSYLAGCCFIVTGLNKSIPVELNESFIGCNLAKGRSLIFGWMFFILFLWQIMHILPPCFINDLPFKIQYILLMFTRIYSGPRCPYLL